MRARLALALATAIAALGLSGCGGVTDPAQNVVETFTGTVPVGGFDFKAFNISRAGEFSITVLSLTPPASVFFVVSFGQMIGGTCVPSQTNVLSTAAHTVLNGAIQSPGSYCVRVADEQTFTVPETYTLQVSHP
jgi:hypothetical protein